MIFQLQVCDYDCNMIYYFESSGTTEADFKSLCDRLMRKSAQDILEGKTRSPLHTSIPAWIGYDVLVNEVVARLPDYGYKQVHFPGVTYNRASIFRSPEDDEDKVFSEEEFQALIAYNKETEDKLQKAREARRKNATKKRT